MKSRWKRAKSSVLSIYHTLCAPVPQEEGEDMNSTRRRLLKFSLIFMCVMIFRVFEYDIKYGMQSGFQWVDEQRGVYSNVRTSLPKAKIQHIFSFNNKECELDKIPTTNWSLEMRPRFLMDPNKFLYPILKNEPVDQLMGLRQAMLLALRLNR